VGGDQQGKHRLRSVSNFVPSPQRRGAFETAQEDRDQQAGRNMPAAR